MGVLLSMLVAAQVSFDHCPIGLRFFSSENKPLINDSIDRWKNKNAGSDPDLKDRCPVVMEIDDKKCIKLQKIILNVGEDPIYCYEKSGKLIKAYDDVE